jgi:hypothetical protein
VILCYRRIDSVADLCRRKDGIPAKEHRSKALNTDGMEGMALRAKKLPHNLVKKNP